MKWYVLTTRPHHERAVSARLIRKAFEAYLPMARGWRTSNGVRRATFVPLFARHVFVRCYLEMYTHLELITTPGVTGLREGPQSGFLVVPDEEIRVLQQITDAGLPLERAPYPIRGGEYVRVIQGPLQDIAGVLRDGFQAALLIPVHSLKESVAVRINGAQVIPVAPVQARIMEGESSGDREWTRG